MVADKKALMQNMFMGVHSESAIKEISLQDLVTFHTGEYGHVFKVKNDDDMDLLKEKIIKDGQLEPIIVREDTIPGKYEIIAGHRRTNVCKRLGFSTIKAIIVDYDDEKAIKAMVSTNIDKRSELLPSERAFAYKAYMTANKAQGKRSDLNNTKAKNTNTEAEKLFDTNRETIRQTIKLTNLTPELLDLVDKKRIKIYPASVIANLPIEAQECVYDSLKINSSLSADIAKQLLDNHKNNKLNSATDVQNIFIYSKEEKKKKVTINEKTIDMILPKSVTEFSPERKLAFLEEAVDYYLNVYKDKEA